MQPIRVKTVQESDLRMLGNLARNIQRVLPVTQADIDAAAALGNGWVVWKVFEVSEPLDNMRGGTQLIIRQNSIQPGQNVRRVIFVSGPGGQTVVIRGSDYLVLPDAVANSLSYVKAFGGTEQNGTPTPTQPLPLVSNNGVLKARHQSGLPLGYTLLDYIESSGTQYIDLGYKGNGSTKVEIKFKYYTTTSASGSGRVFGSRNAAAVDAFAIGSASGTASTNSTVAFFFGNQSYLVTDKSLVLDEWLDVVFDKTTHNINGTDYGDPYNDETFETPQTLKVFGFDNNGTMGYGYVDIAYCKLWDNGVLVRDLVPVKDSSNVIGMYDLVSGQFFTNQGTGTFTAGTAVSDPVEIYTDGTVETINVHGKNLFDKNTVSTIAPNTLRSDFIRVVPGVVYSMSTRGASVIIEYDSEQTQLRTLYIGTTTYTPSADTVFAKFNVMNTYLNTFQLERGSTATTYEPYYDGGTATAEMLLKVGDYQDVQSIIDGVVTRKCGVLVIDGTESWQTGAAGRYYLSINDQYLKDTYTPLCTHFPMSTNAGGTGDMTTPDTLALYTGGVGVYQIYAYPSTATASSLVAWKAFLAAQYAAGTPVIVIYPLATPTTESVAGQTLQVTDGDNVLEITQASLDNLELEAKYQAAVSLTIQEVQDANLDPNVEVTIN